MNERRLRRVIREALMTEAAKGPADLPPGVSVTIEGNGQEIRIYYSDPMGDELWDGPIEGYIEIVGGDDMTWDDCDGAWEVARAKATQGWGPMLYDVAMEWATERGGGLISDRDQVSPKAQVVWNYYRNSRGDVTALSLEDDECDVTFTGAAEALDYRYTKAPNLIPALQSRGLLIRR